MKSHEHHAFITRPRHRVANKDQGFIALISIVIIGALTLAISMGVSLRSVGETNLALGEEMSLHALSLAEACAEYAILRLKNNLNYEGNENIIVEGSYSCDILAVEGVDNLNRTVKTESLIRGYKRKIKVDIAQVRPLKINSWLELADF